MRATAAILRLGMVGALAASAWLGQPPGRAQATFPGRDGRIAFWDANTRQIYAVDPNGQGLVQLTHTPAGTSAAMPAWSPDGRRIVYASDAGGELRLWRMDADGSRQGSLLDGPAGSADVEPVYTPDGRRLVFVRCEATCAIWTARSDGTGAHALTAFTEGQDESFDLYPDVSPDGTTVAFDRRGANGIVSQIYLMGIDGSDPHAITRPGLEAWQASWSPDGRHIAFTDNAEHELNDIHLMDSGGRHIQAVTTTHPGKDSSRVTYAPRGDRVAFRRLTVSTSESRLLSVRPTGGRERHIASSLTGIIDPDWGTAPPLGGSALVSAPELAAPVSLPVWCLRSWAAMLALCGAV
jgi:TolB protein